MPEDGAARYCSLLPKGCIPRMRLRPTVGCMNQRGFWVRMALFAFALACGTLGSLAQKRPEAAQGPSVASRPPDFDAPANEFAGPEQCQSCHKEETVEYEKTSHSKLVFPGKDYIHGCETCHGPAKAHADAIQAAHGDDADVAKALKEHPIFAFQGAPKKTRRAALPAISPASSRSFSNTPNTRATAIPAISATPRT